MIYFASKTINIHLLSYAAVKIDEMSVWILPYHPKVVKPIMPILDSNESLMYTTVTDMGRKGKK